MCVRCRINRVRGVASKPCSMMTLPLCGVCLCSVCLCGVCLCSVFLCGVCVDSIASTSRKISI